MLSYAPGRPISETEFKEKLLEFLTQTNFSRGRLLVIIPDDTRTLPMPLLFDALVAELLPRVKNFPSFWRWELTPR